MAAAGLKPKGGGGGGGIVPVGKPVGGGGGGGGIVPAGKPVGGNGGGGGGGTGAGVSNDGSVREHVYTSVVVKS